MKISIITATFNSQDTVLDTIQSVVSQTHEDWELIIQDGCSSDQTIQIIENNYENDKRIKIYSEKDTGIYNAMNRGWRRSCGDIVGMLNSDDIFYDGDVLARINQSIQSGYKACYGNIVMTDANDLLEIKRVWKSRSYKNNLMLNGWMPPHPSFYCTRNIFKKLDGFNEDYKGGSDYDFMLRVLENKENSSEYIPEFFVRMRYGGDSTKNIKNIILFNLECLKSRNIFLGRSEYYIDTAFFKKPLGKILQFFYKKTS